MAITIYHNPRCGKSRDTLALLEKRGITPRIVEYLKTPPDTKTLKRLLEQLGLKPRQLLRKKEAAEAGLDDPELSDDALIAGMVKHPITIERPIVVNGDKAALGRPPEAVLKIL
jgi:arsenate reductase (glutaredoxin)